MIETIGDGSGMKSTPGRPLNGYFSGRKEHFKAEKRAFVTAYFPHSKLLAWPDPDPPLSNSFPPSKSSRTSNRPGEKMRRDGLTQIIGQRQL
jgi:hypothetical protein